MGNKITVLLVVALFLLVGCSETSEQSESSQATQSELSDLSDVAFDTSLSESRPDDASEASDASETIDISEPEKRDPEISEPETSDPAVSEPEVSEPEVSEPEVSQPDISEPEVSEPEVSEPEIVIKDETLVLISDYIPDIKTDIRYATENNFTGKVIYASSDAYLRYGTVKKLIEVQAELNELGYELLIWDAYRPTEAQWKLWEVCPDATFVSDPNKGYSSHSRGNTVDITIVRLDGSEVEMPSGFDEFTPLADRDYSDVSETAAKNSKLLEEIMTRNGFSGYRKEWWHYSDTVKYDVAE